MKFWQRFLSDVLFGIQKNKLLDLVLTGYKVVISIIKFDPGDLVKSPLVEEKFQNVKDYKKELLQCMFLYILGVWLNKSNEEVDTIISEALNNNSSFSTSFVTSQGKIKVTTDLSIKRTILEFEGEDYERKIK